MDRLFAVEIVYRGIFQKKLAANISRAIVLAAHKEGKPGISFGRYGDSPERNGIPAKYFAIVATDETTLEEGKAKYEPKGVDISICVDDTLFKGVESWAWYGLQPINKLLKPGGTLIVTSLKEADQLIPLAHRKETPYKLAVLKGTPSFSGLWVYKDDHTDVRILGVMARVLPELFSLGSVQETIRDEWKNELKATSALRAFERVTTVTVTPDQGNPTEPYKSASLPSSPSRRPCASRWWRWSATGRSTIRAPSGWNTMTRSPSATWAGNWSGWTTRRKRWTRR